MSSYVHTIKQYITLKILIFRQSEANYVFSRRRRIGSGYIVSRRVKSPKDDGFTREQSSGFLAPHSTPSPSAMRSPHRRTVEPAASIQSLRRLNSDELQMNVKSMLAENGTTDSVWKVSYPRNIENAGSIEKDRGGG